MKKRRSKGRCQSKTGKIKDQRRTWAQRKGAARLWFRMVIWKLMGLKEKQRMPFTFF
jgi:hypothetical protein